MLRQRRHLQPHRAGDCRDAVLAPKLRTSRETGAACGTGNPGCLMQIGAGLRRSGATARVVHPIDLLDAAYSNDAGS